MVWKSKRNFKFTTLWDDSICLWDGYFHQTLKHSILSLSIRLILQLTIANFIGFVKMQNSSHLLLTGLEMWPFYIFVPLFFSPFQNDFFISAVIWTVNEKAFPFLFLFFPRSRFTLLSACFPFDFYDSFLFIKTLSLQCKWLIYSAIFELCAVLLNAAQTLRKSS